MNEQDFERDTGLYMPNDDGVLESIRTDPELRLGLLGLTFFLFACIGVVSLGLLIVHILS